MTTIVRVSDPKSTINRANLGITCGKCHGDSSVMQGTSISNRPFLSYQESVHGRAISRGNTSAAVCSDCHGSHQILPASDAQAPISKSNIPATCGKGHASIAVEFSQSVHGQAVARGVSRAPVYSEKMIDSEKTETKMAMSDDGNTSAADDRAALPPHAGCPRGDPG